MRPRGRPAVTQPATGPPCQANTSSSHTSRQRAQRVQSALVITGPRPCAAPCSAGAITCGSGQTRKHSPHCVQASRRGVLMCSRPTRPIVP